MKSIDSKQCKNINIWTARLNQKTNKNLLLQNKQLASKQIHKHIKHLSFKKLNCWLRNKNELPCHQVMSTEQQKGFSRSNALCSGSRFKISKRRYRPNHHCRRQREQTREDGESRERNAELAAVNLLRDKNWLEILTFFFFNSKKTIAYKKNNDIKCVCFWVLNCKVFQNLNLKDF